MLSLHLYGIAPGAFLRRTLADVARLAALEELTLNVSSSSANLLPLDLLVPIPQLRRLDLSRLADLSQMQCLRSMSQLDTLLLSQQVPLLLSAGA